MPARTSFLCWLAALSCALPATLAEAEVAAASSEPRVLASIDRYRKATWRWQRLMRVARTPTQRTAERSTSAAYRRYVLDVWKGRARRARNRAYRPPYLSAWLCIHRREGAWTANTGNGYFGGLQMNLAFQRRYGGDLVRWKGLAHRWLPIEQIWVGVRAHRSGRGFYPWPNAARACGLI
jgi:hypothetical protein